MATDSKRGRRRLILNLNHFFSAFVFFIASMRARFASSSSSSIAVVIVIGILWVCRAHSMTLLCSRRKGVRERVCNRLQLFSFSFLLYSFIIHSILKNLNIIEGFKIIITTGSSIIAKAFLLFILQLSKAVDLLGCLISCCAEYLPVEQPVCCSLYALLTIFVHFFFFLFFFFRPSGWLFSLIRNGAAGAAQTFHVRVKASLPMPMPSSLLLSL